METKGITCRIPLALHQKITEEMRAQGITVGQFIEQIIHEHYEKGDPTMAKTRTIPGTTKKKPSRFMPQTEPRRRSWCIPWPHR